MTDDRKVKESARDPEREALGSVRGGLRAAAKKAVRKVARKAAPRKKAASKAAAGAGRTSARGATSAKKADRTVRTAAAPASGAAGASSARTGAAPVTAAPAEPAAPSREPGPSIDTPRPPGPMHPGAAMDSMQEHSGGLGGLLALWGPLIIVGFLVLVFRGGDEPETTAAAGTGAADPATIDAAAGTARAAAPSGAAPGVVETFDGGFAMRTSMAGPPALTGRGVHAESPAVAPGSLYPSPPGPYRDPRYRSLPTGESWSAEGTGEWTWSTEAQAGARPPSGAAPVRWVRCEAPYYWCPAPSSPVW